jgi:hypothetical protein
VDVLQPNYAQPTTIVGADGANGVEVLSNSLVTNDAGDQSYSNATLYTAQSGARVFNAGTIQWSWGVDDFSLWPVPRYCTYWQTQQITANLLHNFITGATTPGTVVN